MEQIITPEPTTAPLLPMPSKKPMWVTFFIIAVLALHFVYDFAVYTGTVPQRSVKYIIILLFIIEIISIIYLIYKKRYIAYLFLLLIAINIYIGIPLVKFAVTHTAVQEALQGNPKATKNLTVDEGLKVLNQEAVKINELNTKSGKLWNVPPVDFATMDNTQFHNFMQQLLDIYEQKKIAVDQFKLDYNKYKQNIDIKQGETPGFDKMYAWAFVSPNAISCYEAQYNAQVPIIKAALQQNYDSVTSEQKQTYYQDTFGKANNDYYQICHSF